MPARPGRPNKQDSAEASARIIDAACLYFARQGVKGSTYKQIGAAAGVSAAMVHYYFKQKEDLYLAVIESAFKPLMEKLEKIEDLDTWVQNFHKHIMDRLWFPHLMLREVLPHNGELRSLFLAHCAPHVFGSLKALVSQEVASVPRAEELDVDRHVVLLMGMLVYPFLGMEIVQNVTGRKFDKRMLNSFRDDALALFHRGIGTEPPSGRSG